LLRPILIDNVTGRGKQRPYKEKPMANAKQIDPKLLAGLKFHDAEQKEVMEDGRKKMVSVQTARELTPDDVLDWVDKGDAISFVTADGQKYLVEKKAAEKK